MDKIFVISGLFPGLCKIKIRGAQTDPISTCTWTLPEKVLEQFSKGHAQDPTRKNKEAANKHTNNEFSFMPNPCT